jgi:hypothetical protein
MQKRFCFVECPLLCTVSCFPVESTSTQLWKSISSFLAYHPCPTSVSIVPRSMLRLDHQKGRKCHIQVQSSLLRPHILLLAGMQSEFFHSLGDTWILHQLHLLSKCWQQGWMGIEIDSSLQLFIQNCSLSQSWIAVTDSQIPCKFMKQIL